MTRRRVFGLAKIQKNRNLTTINGTLALTAANGTGRRPARWKNRVPRRLSRGMLSQQEEGHEIGHSLDAALDRPRLDWPLRGRSPRGRRLRRRLPQRRQWRVRRRRLGDGRCRLERVPRRVSSQTALPAELRLAQAGQDLLACRLKAAGWQGGRSHFRDDDAMMTRAPRNGLQRTKGKR
jgi:hypothetical protein